MTYFLFRTHILIQMLKTESYTYYQIKKGQTLRAVADYFSVSEYLLAGENSLSEDVYVGQILKIPQERGNIYFVQEGDSKELLSGSEENYRRKNGTDIFYIGMRVIL